jgi:hypothetical protein
MDCIALAIERPHHRCADAGGFGIAAYAELAAQLHGERPQNLHAETGRAIKVVVRREPFAFVGHAQPIALPVVRKSTARLPPSCFAPLVRSSLTIRPIGCIQVVGTLSSSPETAISSPSTGESSLQSRLRKPTHETLSVGPV